MSRTIIALGEYYRHCGTCRGEGVVLVPKTPSSAELFRSDSEPLPPADAHKPELAACPACEGLGAVPSGTPYMGD